MNSCWDLCIFWVVIIANDSSYTVHFVECMVMWPVLWGTDIRGLVFILIVFALVKALISRQQGLTNRLEKKNDLVDYKSPRGLEKLTWGLCHRTGSAKTPLPVPSPFPTPTTMPLHFQHWWPGKVDATIAALGAPRSWTCHKSLLSLREFFQSLLCTGSTQSKAWGRFSTDLWWLSIYLKV